MDFGHYDGLHFRDVPVPISINTGDHMQAWMGNTNRRTCTLAKNYCNDVNISRVGRPPNSEPEKSVCKG